MFEKIKTHLFYLCFRGIKRTQDGRDAGIEGTKITLSWICKH
jgi:hypothetical protein